MMVSTKGRYAIRILLDLAENYSGAYIPMKEVAARQGLSLKYIEQIMPLLKKANAVEGVHGKGGGYRLVKRPEEYKIGDILRMAEGSLAPVACLECDAKPCERAGECRTLPMWTKFYEMTNEYFDSVTLADLIGTEVAYNYEI